MLTNNVNYIIITYKHFVVAKNILSNFMSKMLASLGTISIYYQILDFKPYENVSIHHNWLDFFAYVKESCMQDK